MIHPTKPSALGSRRAGLLALAAAVTLAPGAPVAAPRGVGVDNRAGEPVLARVYQRSYALVVGIDAYRQLDHLRGARRDARNVAKALRERGMDVTLLLDGQATRQRITELLGDTYSRRVDPNDRVLVYFAGHGVSVGSGDATMGYLMPVDADRDHIRSKGISMSELQRWFGDYRSKHVLFVADACYSGLAITRQIGLSPQIRGYLDLITSKRVRMALVAGGEGEEANEWNGEGLFTHFFLEGIGGAADANADGLITGSELAVYVKPNVATIARARFNRSQSPQMGRQGEGEFVFASPLGPGAGGHGDPPPALPGAPGVTASGAPPADAGGPILPWALVGAGVALAAGGALFHVMNAGAASRLRDDPGDGSLRDEVDRTSALALGGYIAGGTLLTVGGAWLLIAADERAGSPATVAVGPGMIFGRWRW